MQYVKNSEMGKNNICSRCGKNSLVTDFESGERACSKCFAVEKEELIDQATDYEKKEGSGGRTGPQENKMMQQSSMISQSGVDASGHPLRGEAKMVAKRISVWDKRDQLKDQKTVMIANMEISRLSDILKINNTVKQRGAEIFRECFEQKLIQGRTALVFSASCLYAACRESGQSVTIKDFIKNSNCERSNFISYFRFIIDTLDIQTENVSPKKFISRIASRTEPPINAIIEKHACDIVDQLSDQAGKDPIGLAAAALCYACRLKNYKHTLRNIAIAADVNEVTVRNRIKDIEKFYKKE